MSIALLKDDYLFYKSEKKKLKRGKESNINCILKSYIVYYVLDIALSISLVKSRYIIFNRAILNSIKRYNIKILY